MLSYKGKTNVMANYNVMTNILK